MGTGCDVVLAFFFCPVFLEIKFHPRSVKPFYEVNKF